jgi:hypothetical protein
VKPSRLTLLFVALLGVIAVEGGLRLRDHAVANEKKAAELAADARVVRGASSRVLPWQSLGTEVQRAQDALLSRLTESPGVGHFRAASLEALGEMCQREELACTVSLSNELETSTSNVGTSASSASSQRASSAPLIDRTQVPSDALIVNLVRVQLTMKEDHLERFLRALARESIVFAVTRMNVRGARAEFTVRAVAKPITAAKSSGLGNVSSLERTQ